MDFQGTRRVFSARMSTTVDLAVHAISLLIVTLIVNFSLIDLNKGESQ